MKTKILIILTIIFFIFSSHTLVNALGDSENPDNLKAVWITRLVEFVEWPDEGIGKPSKPFIIGVFGESPVYFHLVENVEFYNNKNNKNIQLIRITKTTSPELKNCHILFISNCSKTQFNNILDEIAGLPILTIGDTPRYEEKGVMINIFPAPRGTLGFNVNMVSAEKCRIQLTSKILMRAKNIIKK